MEPAVGLSLSGTRFWNSKVLMTSIEVYDVVVVPAPNATYYIAGLSYGQDDDQALSPSQFSACQTEKGQYASTSTNSVKMLVKMYPSRMRCPL
jgi:hypothetical protein